MAIHEQTASSPTSNENAFTQVLTRVHSVKWEYVAYAAILVLALMTRFIGLGDRVMSHDESLHTYYSWRLYEFGEFSHTPLMHGPVLFHMVALSYFMFGDSDFTARLYPAVLGILMVFYPVLLRRWIGRVGALLASVMMLISPMIMFHNRYIREDTPSVFFTMIMVYAALQYIDGVRPRRPVWLVVLAGSLLLTLASKEVAFIYIAIFGSYWLLVWLMRIVQDVGIVRRPADVTAWEPPLLQQFLGHVILLVMVGVLALTVGRFIRFLFSPILWIPSNAWIEVPLFLVLYVPLALSGMLRRRTNGADLTELAEGSKPKRGPRGRGGVASAIMQGVASGKSTLFLALVGLILGAIMALWIACVIDVIKPDQVWTQNIVRSGYDQMSGANMSKEYALSVGFESSMFIRLMSWVMLPAMVMMFVVFITAVFGFPRDLPLPWREILIILLIAFLVTSFLVMFERRSFVSSEESQPFAASLTAAASTDDGKYDNISIYMVWVLGSLITLGVVASRFLTNWWQMLNRQPIFDVLIIIGSLALPWLAAFPLYWAGYELENYDPNSTLGQDTFRAALLTVIPFFMVSASVGLSWNWKRWLPATAVFMGLFAFFFTTVFSNQYGLVTGMIGSLGYWLVQQEVRRGSQPQYYYLLTQLPVYEFLPLLGSLCAGFFGLTQLWRWRRERAEVVRDALYAAEQATLESGAELPSPESGSMAQTMIASTQRTAIMFAPPESEADGELIGLAADDEDAPPDDTPNEEYAVQEYAVPSRPAWDFPAALARPFDWIEEQSRRASDPEWIGAFPFLAMVGWWAIAMTLGLTIAGEKMPWLTTHLSVPMILISGWWLGRIASGIRRETLRDNGWLVLLVVLPLALMSFGQVVLGFWEGKPFQGADVRDLMASGNWFGALLIFLGALYVIGHFGRRIGVEQIGRMTVLSGAAVLGVLTLRAAIMACFINYDYATEYLVYAHSGPAVKTALAEIDRIAEITNEGANMRIVFDDESSWPYTWYLRDYPNYGYLRGEAGSVDASSMDGARVVIVGSKKVGDVRRILGDRYYEFAYFRLWWPMQEYFNLNYERVSNVFSTEEGNIAARYYRQALWDIWLDRDYQTYAQAMCIEAKQYRCEEEANWGTNDDERDQFRESCERAVVLECAKDDRFTASKWPVSDRMYFFVDKQIAAQVWDAGIGSSTVDIREPEYPEDRVFQFIDAEAILGANLGMVGPRGIALDADGLIYVADTERHQILVMDGQGALVRTIGQPLGAPEAGGLKQPWDIDIAPDGTIYIADTWNNRVAVFAADGTYLRAWGHEGIPGSDPSTDAMWGPRAIMVGPDGNIYVADTGGKRVRKYSPEGEWLDDLGRGGSAIGEVDEPVGLAFNPISQEVYVAEAWNKRIQAFDGAGDPLRTFDVSMWFRNRQSYNRPYIAVSPDGTLIYVVDMDDKHRIVAYNLNGEPVLSFNQPDKLEENLLGVRSPAGIAVDAAGRLYVVDSEQAKVYVFPPSQIAGQIAPVAPGAIPDNAFPESFSPDSSGSDASSESEAGSPAQDDPNAAGQDSSPAEEGDSAPAGEVIATPAG